MASEKVETVIAGNYVEMEQEEATTDKSFKSKFSKLFWHGGSVYDAWFSCASNQVRYLHFLNLFNMESNRDFRVRSPVCLWFHRTRQSPNS